eukprot:TRINITY_DN30588_c0_g1_i1.p1 TRINITY_DN30588_c0_g1~~TRINITY_DN30588_c0_g1_i1.p1  ORF type:complete len:199 (-),score=20.93 TRINITY_DN30588_c0_g1_i1:62-658(-)
MPGALKLLESIAKRRPPQKMSGTCAQYLQAGANVDAIEEVGRSLRLRLLPELRELYAFADGQKSDAPGNVLMVPQNLPLTFLPLAKAQALALDWRKEVDHPVRGKYWKDAGYNPKWFPIGFHESKQVALCVSTEAGRVTRFTTPEGQYSHATEGHKHLSENLEDYLRDLDAYLAGIRQPFIGLGTNLGSNIEGPGICI